LSDIGDCSDINIQIYTFSP